MLRVLPSRSFVLLACFSLAVVTPALVGQEPGLGIRWREPIEVASGAGHRGPWQQNESDFRYVDDPTVAIDDTGAVTVAWVDQAQKDIFLQVYAADGSRRFAQPVNVSRTPAVFSWLPRVVVSPADSRQIAVLWQEIVFSGGSHGGDIFFARSTDGGRTFSAPVNLSRSVAGSGKGRLDAETWDNGSLDLAQDADGRLYAAWTDYEGSLWFIRSSDRGTTFEAPVLVAGAEGRPAARGPSLAVGPTGAVFLAWTVGEDPAANIQLTRSNDGGRTFREARAVAESRGQADAPKIAVDRRGVLHLVYGESPAGDLRQSQVRYTRSTDGGDQFAPPQEISRAARSGGPGAGFPSLALDRDGRIFVTWELYPERGAWSRGLGMTLSKDGGRRFAPPILVPNSVDAAGFNGSQQGLLMRKLAVNALGAVAVVNSTFRPQQSSHIWLYRGQSAR